jgi:hypothetical protein
MLVIVNVSCVVNAQHRTVASHFVVPNSLLHLNNYVQSDITCKTDALFSIVSCSRLLATAATAQNVRWPTTCRRRCRLSYAMLHSIEKTEKITIVK